MTKYFCDCCGEEQNDRMYPIRLMKHIVAHNPISGHGKMLPSGEMVHISGVEVTLECCIKCYNKMMYKFWNENKDNFKMKFKDE